MDEASKEKTEFEGVVTECPCCGWGGFKSPPKSEDDAVLGCRWCTTNVLGEPRLCAMAEEILNRSIIEAHRRGRISHDEK